MNRSETGYFSCFAKGDSNKSLSSVATCLTKGNAFCVQVVTVNDYLARRDSEWVGQVHRFLGLQVGLVQQGLDVRFLT